ncbi:S-adenosyl-L-methionine-dependent methyltransferase [Sodiomyces alkalinus F11]|uniref:S-adenosyl-L-methionine-dependent methyltransferase n=1 Tax=Sodiomyces alkalinus (strain CBS 110278 / VKM F-3762 / F11) TaxID=1314773 RepID=A0A3N2PLE9_SODAK|nr:S-adenosyl-L-methionine-dependent methyltransferase [Sodiomyces alkalinus F11]ROT35342.1 S-adenosyl-L-methionine-dependent methyltransferase [Sodiomyces alkalinus F11]
MAAEAQPGAAPLEIDDDAVRNERAVTGRIFLTWTQQTRRTLLERKRQPRSFATTSLAPSVLDYKFVHGRRFHAYKEGAYVMPNDDDEQDRLDLAHLMNVKAIGNKLYLAPLDAARVQRILDLGTGTGIWAIEMGEEFPGAEVLGNDLIMLTSISSSRVPPNVKFEVDDVEAEWTHSEKFDFVFCRYMSAGIWKWPEFVKRVFGGVAPGGWAEFQDYDMRYFSEDGSLTEKHHTKKWIDTLLGAAAKVGREPIPGVKLREWAEEAGFENVTEKVFRMPIGPWAKNPDLKQVGHINLVQVLQGLEAFSLRLFCDVEGWDEAEVTVLLANVRKELQSGAFHAQIKLHVVYGQKPGTAA